jgi:BirA family biotin operon repressor/biotin-[acetyl-CoA-carboxylase] ligase
MTPILNQNRKLVVFDSIGSTQQVMREWVKTGRTDVGAVLAYEQTAGVGRFGRTWYSPKGESLSITVALFDCTDHTKPEFLGMAIAVAVAECLDLSLQWPNDLVVKTDSGVLKVGGILGEMVRAPRGVYVPIIGVGINLQIKTFPKDLQHKATSVSILDRKVSGPKETAELILEAIESMPEPQSWSDLAARWTLRDLTPEKRYTLSDGKTVKAIGVSKDGELLVDYDGQQAKVRVADAVYELITSEV